MNVRYGKNKRKAISPVLATVILIAITLIAAIAIAGFVFGLFGSFTSSANISAQVVDVPASMATGTTFSVANACATAPCGQLTLTNSGTASATVSTFTITYGGSTYTASLATAIKVTAGGSAQVYITALPAGAASGEQFTGSITVSNGGSVPYTGSFQ